MNSEYEGYGKNVPAWAIEQVIREMASRGPEGNSYTVMGEGRRVIREAAKIAGVEID